jgi:hypothetical protein
MQKGRERWGVSGHAGRKGERTWRRLNTPMMVWRRCAIVTRVEPGNSSRSVCCTSSSVWLSIEAVASSRRRILLFLRRARAKQMSCFSPCNDQRASKCQRASLRASNLVRGARPGTHLAEVIAALADLAVKVAEDVGVGLLDDVRRGRPRASGLVSGKQVNAAEGFEDFAIRALIVAKDVKRGPKRSREDRRILRDDSQGPLSKVG